MFIHAPKSASSAAVMPVRHTPAHVQCRPAGALLAVPNRVALERRRARRRHVHLRRDVALAGRAASELLAVSAAAAIEKETHRYAESTTQNTRKKRATPDAFMMAQRFS